MELAVKLVNIIIKITLFDKNWAETLSQMPQIHTKMRENELAAGFAPDPAWRAHNKYNYKNDSIPWNLLWN